ncbi:MAG: hypothetical protein ABFD60_11210 [Bryobacteraceae bacterium]
MTETDKNPMNTMEGTGTDAPPIDKQSSTIPEEEDDVSSSPLGNSYQEEETDSEGLDAVQELLAEFEDRGGFSLRIERIAPTWCHGHCTTIPLESQPTYEDIKSAFGGHRFRLVVINKRGRQVGVKTISISDLPRVDGVPITSLSRAPEVKAAEPSSDAGGLAGLVRELIVQQQQAALRQQSFLEKLLFSQMQGSDSEADSPVGRIQETFEIIEAAKRLGGGGGEDTSSMNMALQVADKFFDRMDKRGASRRERPGPAGAPPHPRVIYRQIPAAPVAAPATTPAAPPIAPPAAPPAPVAAAKIPTAPPAAPPAQIVTSSNPVELNLEDIGDALSEAIEDDADSAALELKGIFDQLSPSKQMRIAKILMGEIDPRVDKTPIAGGSFRDGDPRDHG